MKKMIKQVLMLVFIIGSLLSQMIISMEPQRIELNVSQASLTALYKNDSQNSYLYIPREQLIGVDGVPINLKDLFTSKGFFTNQRGMFLSDEAWTDKEWERNFSKLINMPKETEAISFYDHQYHKNKYTLDQLLALLADAKTVVKSFLAPDSNIQHSQAYIKKTGLKRLFAYAKLQHTIAEKNLKHVRLPLKYILIKDNKTGAYISKEEASKVIDASLKVYIIDGLVAKIRFVSDRYELDIFASKEEKQGKGFSKAAMEELVTLCKIAPFDIGHDNIFWNVKGDAVIIDTEHKGEKKGVCGKLARYPVNLDL